MAYFEYFPAINYDIRGNKNEARFEQITNILKRVRKKIEVNNAALFEQYFIQDGDRADTLAYQFYGDSTLLWIIMYANYMTNPYYDWPLNYFDLQKYVADKYKNSGGVTGTHHYENSNGDIVDAPGTLIAPGVTASGGTAITNFLYEEKLNDKKRTIDIIRLEYLQQIINEFKRFIA